MMVKRFAACLLLSLAGGACSHPRAPGVPRCAEPDARAALADTMSALSATSDPGQVVVRTRRAGASDSSATGRFSARLAGGGTRLESAALAGELLFRGVPPGDYVLTVSATGYRSRTVPLRVPVSGGVDAAVSLVPARCATP